MIADNRHTFALHGYRIKIYENRNVNGGASGGVPI